MTKPQLFTIALALLTTAAAPPAGRIGNGLIALDYAVPDPANGFYRGTRFDWSGIVTGLRYRGQNFYKPWFIAVDPAVRDTRAGETGVTVGPNSAATGPVEEFVRDGKPIGFDAAAPGGRFLKIGVGVLGRPDDAAYSQFRAYPIVDGGRWETKADTRSVRFRQTLADAASGYGYVYEKTLRLLPGQPVLVIEHSLRNTGATPLQTEVYDHNFLVTADHVSGPDWVVRAPAAIKVTNAPDPLAAVAGQTISYVRPLASGERIFVQFAAGDRYDFAVTNRATGQGYRVEGDQPVAHATLWSIRPTLSLEPFVAIDVAPGAAFRWSYRYTYSAR